MATVTLTRQEAASLAYVNSSQSKEDDPYSREVERDVMALFSEMLEDSKRVEHEAEKKFEFSSLAVGISTGIFCHSLGPYSALAFGLIAAYTCRNLSTISDTAKTVYLYCSRTPVLPCTSMKPEELIRISRNSADTLEINFGNEVRTLSFNLNDRKYPIAQKDLRKFYGFLFKKLENRTLDPKRC